MLKLYIFDKDWTICQPSDGGKFINNIDQQVLMPGVAEKCASLRAQSHRLAVASNQGGVAFDGLMTKKEANFIVAHAAGLIEADMWALCPHHPGGNNRYAIECVCRKPAPGMLLRIMGLNWRKDQTIFIGDLDTDRQAAEAAGVEFVWASEFFKGE